MINSQVHPPAPPRRVFNLDDDDGITHALFREFALSERAYHSRGLTWPTDLRRFPDLGDALASGCNPYFVTRIVRRGSVLCHVRLREGIAQVALAAPEEEELDLVEAQLRGLIPRRPDRPDDDRCSVIRFWYHAPHGAASITRRISVPDWGEIRANYPPATADELAALMDGWRPADSGRLLLWHGPPGTGKTFALRALTWQWRGWCEAHYIIDPERFFGERPDYMLEVLLDRSDDETEIPAEGDAESQDHERRAARWRLLILEDTGELLAADAKEREGQGLSRLLNLVDGLIGQGLRVVVLVTGNEPLRRLHPAISRPGRCAAIAAFQPSRHPARRPGSLRAVRPRRFPVVAPWPTSMRPCLAAAGPRSPLSASPPRPTRRRLVRGPVRSALGPQAGGSARTRPSDGRK